MSYVRMGSTLMIALLLCIGQPLAEEKYQFSSEQQRLDFMQLSQELRCPKCQNQNIADSNALISTDMKRKVYQLLQQGKTRGEVISYMKSRYGDFVHYQPPLTPLTLWLYLGPLTFILVMVVYLFYKRRTNLPPLTSGPGLEPEGTVDPEQQEQLARAEKALKELE